MSEAVDEVAVDAWDVLARRVARTTAHGVVRSLVDDGVLPSVAWLDVRDDPIDLTDQRGAIAP